MGSGGGDGLVKGLVALAALAVVKEAVLTAGPVFKKGARAHALGVRCVIEWSCTVGGADLLNGLDFNARRYDGVGGSDCNVWGTDSVDVVVPGQDGVGGMADAREERQDEELVAHDCSLRLHIDLMMRGRDRYSR